MPCTFFISCSTHLVENDRYEKRKTIQTKHNKKKICLKSAGSQEKAEQEMEEKRKRQETFTLVHTTTYTPTYT